MGVFWQTLKVGNPRGGDLVEIDAMVDTGATDPCFQHPCLPVCIWNPLHRTRTLLPMDGL